MCRIRICVLMQEETHRLWTNSGGPRVPRSLNDGVSAERRKCRLRVATPIPSFYHPPNIITFPATFRRQRMSREHPRCCIVPEVAVLKGLFMLKPFCQSSLMGKITINWSVVFVDSPRLQMFKLNYEGISCVITARGSTSETKWLKCCW